MEQIHFVASSTSCFVHPLLVHYICAIKCRILHTLYLKDVVWAGLVELIANFLVFFSVHDRIQLNKIDGFFSKAGIGWLGSPIMWKLDI